MKTDHTTFGGWLRATRTTLGWSQADMAEYLHLDGRQRVSDIERGRREIQPAARRFFLLLVMVLDHIPAAWAPADVDAAITDSLTHYMTTIHHTPVK